MRLRSLGLVLVVAAPCAPLACISSDNSAPPPAGDAGGLDATIEDVFVPADTSAPDAADSAPPPDAGAPDAMDAGVDAPGDAGPGITVTVVGLAGPEPGVTVVFDDATGVVTGTGTTGAAGSVSQVVAAGSQVTVLLGAATGSHQLMTVTGVQPGDAITVVDPFTQGLTEEIAPFNGTDDAQAPQYYMQTGPCFLNSVDGFALAAVPGCVASSTFTTLVTAFPNPAGLDEAYRYQKAIPIVTDGGNVAVANLNAWAPTTTTAETLTTASTPDSGISIAFFSESTDSVLFPTQGHFGVDDAGAPTGWYPAHPGFADFVQGEVETEVAASVAFDTDGGTDNFAVYGAISAIAKSGAPPAPTGSMSFDGSQFLPFLSSMTVSAPNPATPSMSWTTTGSVAAADGTFAQIVWSGTTAGTWTFVVAPGATSVTAPALPAAVSAWLPTAGAYYSSPLVATIEADALAGYSALRQAPLLGAGGTGLRSFFVSNGFGGTFPLVPPIATAGSARITALVFMGDNGP